MVLRLEVKKDLAGVLEGVDMENSTAGFLVSPAPRKLGPDGSHIWCLFKELG